MYFNSIAFFYFFLIVVILYFLTPHHYRWMVLLIASFYFYASVNIQATLLLVISIVSIYLASLQIEKTSNDKIKKIYLLGCISVNLGMLILFKYTDFLFLNVNAISSRLMWSLELSYLEFLLPIGISFYVFMAISYIIDVYTQKIKAERNPGIVALFLSFFPHLVAGPIMRGDELIPQFYKIHTFEAQRVSNGLKLIIWGLFKKVVIADRLALYVDLVYLNPANFDGLTLSVATIFFAFQIYCDFSGYCDIAIGCAQILGYDLTDNFNRPYSSTSILHFWRRWHITLYSWLRDYIYIPLGGSRVSRPRYYGNILVVFLISGLWHGANWTFVMWGFILGTFVIVTNISTPFREKWIHAAAVHIQLNQKATFKKFYSLFCVVLTFCLVDFAWIFFRSNSLKEAFFIISSIVSGIINGIVHPASLQMIADSVSLSFGLVWFLTSMLLLLIMGFIHDLQPHIGMRHMLMDTSKYLRGLIIFILILFIVYLGVLAPREFIYFQF